MKIYNGNKIIEWDFFRNFAARFTKRRSKMVESINSFVTGPANSNNPVVMNWGYLENWKSTASLLS